MRIGDYITVKRIPNGLDDETRVLFELCIGQTLPIVAIVAVPETGGELLELHVGRVVDRPDYIHSIWIEKEFVD